jgi:hypothetical protein
MSVQAVPSSRRLLAIDQRDRIVRQLRTLLVEAEAGTITGIAYAVTRPHSSIGYAIRRTRACNSFALLGALQLLAFDLTKELDAAPEFVGPPAPVA